MQLARCTLELFGVVVAKHFQCLVDEIHARVQGPGHILAQDQQLGHTPRRDDIAVDLAVRLEARHRAQQGAPLIIIHGAPNVRRRRQQGVVLDVQDARCIVPSLDVRPEADEMVGFVAEHGPESDAAEQVRAHLDPIQEPGHARGLNPVVVVQAHLQPRRIQVLVHLGSDRAAHRSGRFARCAQAAEYR